MRKRRGRLYFFLPVFYIGALLGLIALQFSKNENFSQAAGDLTVTGRAPTGGTDKDLLDIQIRGRGLSFNLSANNPVILETAEGTKHRLRPTGHDAGKVKNAVTVTLQKDVKLLFETKDKVLTIKPIVPDSFSTALRVTVPYMGENGSKVLVHPYLPQAEIQKGSSRVRVSMAGGLDQIDASSFSIGIRGGSPIPAVITTGTSDQDSVATWIDSGMENRLPGDALEGTLATYWASAYTSWKTDRFLGGVWDVGEGIPRFSGPLAAALMEEALRRGEYPQTADLLAPFIPSHLGEWGMEAVPFLGDMMGNFTARRQIMDQMAFTYDSRSVIDLAGRPRAYLDARFLGSPGVSDKFEKYMLSSDLTKRSYREQIYLLWNLIQAMEQKPSPQWQPRKDQVLKALTTRLVRYNTGVFCETTQGYLDLKANLILAGALLRTEKLQSDPGLKVLAQALIQSALIQKNEKGLVPETLITNGGKILQKEGKVLPEDIYAYMNPGPTTDTVLTGTTILRTAAGLAEKSADAKGIKLVFTFPLGYSHHFIIQNVEPFDGILLHETRWRSDPYFQNYNDGWFYNPTTKTLFVKLKQRAEKEVFQLSFVPEGPQ